MWHFVSAIILLATFARVGAVDAGETSAFAPFYEDTALFTDAIEAESRVAPYSTRLSGIIVPHHLLAADLIARGFRAASGARYKRVVVLLPDHFRKAHAPFVTTHRDFDTVLGPVAVDGDAVRGLLSGDDPGAAALVAESDLFDTEHGLRAVLPFVAHYLPGARLVPVAISTFATRRDADRLADRLAALNDDETLVVQSTDFSHFHPFAEARRFDQQTLNVLAKGDPDEIASLKLGDHVDSVIAMYLQTVLQRRRNARIHILASQNSNERAKGYLKETTSYVTAVYGAFDGLTGFPEPPGAHTFYIAGDFTLGRNIMRMAHYPQSARVIADRILELTGGKPLFVNLEGAVLPNVPRSLVDTSLAMPAPLAAQWFRTLNIRGASLANNHADDFGEFGLELTMQALEEANVRALPNGKPVEFDDFVLFAATDIRSTGTRQKELLSGDTLDALYEYSGAKPVIAFLHWGEEYEPEPTGRAQWLAEELRRRGASLVIGAHPHVRSTGIETLSGGDAAMIYSLGNFLFDQTSRVSSGALAEVRVFSQGTLFVRQISIPDYYEMGLTVADQ